MAWKNGRKYLEFLRLIIWGELSYCEPVGLAFYIEMRKQSVTDISRRLNA